MSGLSYRGLRLDRSVEELHAAVDRLERDTVHRWSKDVTEESRTRPARTVTSSTTRTSAKERARWPRDERGEFVGQQTIAVAVKR